MQALERYRMGTPNVEIVCRSDGVDAAHAADFVLALARIADKRPVTVVDGGLKPARALAAADNAAGVLSVKVLRAATSGDDAGAVRALDLKGLPLGEASFSFKSIEREPG